MMRISPAVLLHGGLLASELGHIAGHVKVLCCVGQPYNENFFYTRGAYFIADASSTFLSLLSLTPLAIQMGIKSGISTPLIALVAAHQVQHAIYISCWHKGPATYEWKSALHACDAARCLLSIQQAVISSAKYRHHVRSVVEWSSTWSQRERKARFGSEHYWKMAGTSFDVVTHIVMAIAHVAWFVLR